VKVLESKVIDFGEMAKVQYIRIEPEDLTITLSQILQTLMDLSWLNYFDEEYMRKSFKQRAQITINEIKSKFENQSDGKLTSDAGEYVVSELAREAIINELNYLDIPLAELLGKKVSGNPGFDFHSQNNATDTVIFGEAKYIANSNAYASALRQIEKFIQNGKDIADIAELRDFCTSSALERACEGKKGFAAAFSAKSTPSEQIINSIKKREDFNKLLLYEEMILVAVNL